MNTTGTAISKPDPYQRSNTPYFGRAYQLNVIPATEVPADVNLSEIALQTDRWIQVSSDQFEPDALRFTFEIAQYATQAGGASHWFADIEIYNCDGYITAGPSRGRVLIADLMTMGSLVIVKAGYQADGEPRTIWMGRVYQPVWERLDVVNFRLTLHCVLNRLLGGKDNLINDTIPAVTSAADQARIIASRSITPIGLTDSQLTLLTSKPLPRAKAVYGDPARYLGELALKNELAHWMTDTSFDLAVLTGDKSTPPDVIYAPPLAPGQLPEPGVTYTLIGAAQQTEQGITFRVLLDPRMQVQSPLPRVGVDLAFVKQMRVQYFHLPPRPLSEVSTYTLIGVRHCGDTRGNEWYSEVTGQTLLEDVRGLIGS